MGSFGRRGPPAPAVRQVGGGAGASASLVTTRCAVRVPRRAAASLARQWYSSEGSGAREKIGCASEDWIGARGGR